MILEDVGGYFFAILIKQVTRVFANNNKFYSMVNILFKKSNKWWTKLYCGNLHD